LLNILILFIYILKLDLDILNKPELKLKILKITKTNKNSNHQDSIKNIIYFLIIICQIKFRQVDEKIYIYINPKYLFYKILF